MSSQANPLSDFSREVAALAERTVRSTVAVQGGGRASSSGFVWRPGLIVTAEETVETDEDISIVDPGGREIAATLVGRDPSTAVALLRIDEATLAPLSAGAVPGLGEIALVVGRGSNGATAHLGIVALSSGAWRSLHGGDIDARIRLDVVAGRSSQGGPVVDTEGGVSGMLVFGPRRSALVIPFATIERVANHLLSKGRVARAYLGLGLRQIRLEGTRALGLIVVGVDPDGPAHRAGMFIGDVITTWNGEAVGGMRGLMRRLGADSVGTTVAFGLLRAGGNIDVSLTIAERAA